jgi:hypothetical protein
VALQVHVVAGDKADAKSIADTIRSISSDYMPKLLEAGQLEQTGNLHNSSKQHVEHL